MTDQPHPKSIEANDGQHTAPDGLGARRQEERMTEREEMSRLHDELDAAAARLEAIRDEMDKIDTKMARLEQQIAKQREWVDRSPRRSAVIPQGTCPGEGVLRHVECSGCNCSCHWGPEVTRATLMDVAIGVPGWSSHRR